MAKNKTKSNKTTKINKPSKKDITLGLSIIVKDEEHVIERMLKTVYPILDYYTIVDTGSTDKTKEVIKKFFDDKGIPGQILDRPFDNFENSRNYAMQQAKKHTDYCIWIDADEEMVIDKSFDKNGLDKDLYMITTYINSMKYTRNELWNNKKDFRWYGPVHEFIVPDTKDKLTSDILQGITINVHMDGGSWINGDVHNKYKKHATLLEDYINTQNRDPRWVFYTAQSYHDSANVPNNKEEREERLRRALRYYTERVNTQGGYFEERYYAQYRIGTISRQLEMPWSETEQELIKAYEIEPLRGESIKIIIDYYQQMGRWSAMYLWTSAAIKAFHNKSPYPKFNGDPNGRLLFLDESLYLWKFLEGHITSCFYTKRLDEAKECFEELMSIMKAMPERFTDEDMNRIMMNRQNILGQIQNSPQKAPTT